jgi:hypothetical protein
MSKEKNEYPKMLYRAGEARKGTGETDVLVHQGEDPVHYRIAKDEADEKALAKEGFSADLSKPGKRPAKAAKASE